jgi:putative PEP-CTERM system histidine kinase
LAESRQFEAYNRLTAFLMHDLKNSVAQLQLLVTNAARHKRNPEFIDDAIGTIANTVERMTRLIEQLRGSASDSRMQPVVVHELVSLAVARCAARVPLPKLDVDEQPVTVRADPERLTSVLEHVIRNAQEATPEHGRVSVGLRTDSQEISIVVEDSGCGMPAEFIRERLFQPFDSTKGAKGMGIGAYQAREYVRMLGGRVEVQSSPGKGTRFAIVLPRVVTAPAS